MRCLRAGRIVVTTRNVNIDDAYAKKEIQRLSRAIMVRLEASPIGGPVAWNAEVLSQIFAPFFTTKASREGKPAWACPPFMESLNNSRGGLKSQAKLASASNFIVFLPAHRQKTGGGRAKRRFCPRLNRGQGKETLAGCGRLKKAVRELAHRVLGKPRLPNPRGRATVSEAIEVWRRRKGVKFDLLVTDVVMPGGAVGL